MSAAVTRRRALAAAGITVAGGIGAAIGLATTHPRRRAAGGPTTSAGPAVPAVAVLQTALRREEALLSTLGPAGAGSSRVEVLRVDHTAHAEALRGLLATYGGAAATNGVSPTSTTPAGTATTSSALGPPSDAQLRTAELTAASAAAADSAALAGSSAALLASISACEATHAAWLA